MASTFRPDRTMFDDDVSLRSYDLEPEQKLRPRQSKSLPLKGQTGRIVRSETKYVPLAKKYYQGFNVKGQEDPLIETLPVGLRRRRYLCLVFVVAACALISLLTFVYGLWIMDQLRMNDEGSVALQVRKESVLFERSLQVDGVSYVGPLNSSSTIPTAIEANGDLQLNSPNQVGVSFLSGTAKQKTNFSVSSQGYKTEGVVVAFSDNDGTTPIRIDEDSITFNSKTTKFGNDTTLQYPAMLTTETVKTESDKDLDFISSDSIYMTSFLSSAIRSNFGELQLKTQTGDISLSASSEGFPQSHLTLTSSAENHIIDLDRLQKPTSNLIGSYKVCLCADGSIYLLGPDSICGDWPSQLNTNPCS